MSKFELHMLAKGFTQRELAKSLDVEEETVSLWMRGKTMPRPQLYPKMAALLGIDAVEIVEFFRNKRHPEPSAA